MSQQQHPIVQMLQEDRRYSLEAYQFVRDALFFGQQELGYGEQSDEMEEDEKNPFLAALAEEAQQEEGGEEEPPIERHLTGQQLCEAIRLYALEQYGYMAKVVLNSWGVHSTGDFGEIVYNLIRIGMMKKSKHDRRGDFNDCYDFSEAFQQRYEITMPKE